MKYSVHLNYYTKFNFQAIPLNATVFNAKLAKEIQMTDMLAGSVFLRCVQQLS